MNARGLIRSMKGTTYTVTRDAGGYVNGVWTPNTSTVNVLAAVQPLTGPELVRLPEGDRERAVFKVYSADEIRTRDEIAVSGVTYQLQNVEPWSGHWKAVAVKPPSQG